MKALSVLALVLGVSSFAQAKWTNCMHIGGRQAIAAAEKSYNTTVELANMSYGKDLAVSLDTSLAEQTSAGSLKPADRANLNVLAALVRQGEREEAIRAKAQTTIDAAYASYMDSFNTWTFSCWQAN